MQGPIFSRCEIAGIKERRIDVLQMYVKAFMDAVQPKGLGDLCVSPRKLKLVHLNRTQNDSFHN